MATNYTQDQLDAAATAATKNGVTVQRGTLGERDTEQAYQDTIESVASLFLCEPNAVYDLAVVVARQLSADCGDLLTAIDALSAVLRRAQTNIPVDKSSVAAAKQVAAAAQRMQRSVAMQTTGTLDITRDRNFLALDQQVQGLLRTMRPLITDGGGIAMTPVEARQYLSTNLTVLLAAYDAVVTTGQRLSDLLAAVARVTSSLTYRSVHSAAVRARTNLAEMALSVEQDPYGAAARTNALTAIAAVAAVRTVGQFSLRTVDVTGVVPAAPFVPPVLTSELIGTLVLAAPTTYQFTHGSTAFSVTVPASPVGYVESNDISAGMVVATYAESLLRLILNGTNLEVSVTWSTYTPASLAAELSYRLSGLVVTTDDVRITLSLPAGDVTGTLQVLPTGLGARLGFTQDTVQGHRTYIDDLDADFNMQLPVGYSSDTIVAVDALVDMVVTADRSVVQLTAGMTALPTEFRIPGSQDLYHVRSYQPVDGRTVIDPPLPTYVRSGPVETVQVRQRISTTDNVSVAPLVSVGSASPWPYTQAAASFDVLTAPTTRTWLVGDQVVWGDQQIPVVGVTTDRIYLAAPIPMGSSWSAINGWALAHQAYRALYAPVQAALLPQVTAARTCIPPIVLDRAVSTQEAFRLITLLTAIDTVVHSIQAATVMLRAYEPRTIVGCFTALRRAGLDRSYDLLLHGALEDFFACTSDQASYAGRTMAAVQAVAANELPVRKDTGRQSPAQRLISSSTSPDYEYSQLDIDNRPPPNVPVG